MSFTSEVKNLSTDKYWNIYSKLGLDRVNEDILKNEVKDIVQIYQAYSELDYPKGEIPIIYYIIGNVYFQSSITRGRMNPQDIYRLIELAYEQLMTVYQKLCTQPVTFISVLANVFITAKILLILSPDEPWSRLSDKRNDTNTLVVFKYIAVNTNDLTIHETGRLLLQGLGNTDQENQLRQLVRDHAGVYRDEIMVHYNWDK